MGSEMCIRDRRETEAFIEWERTAGAATGHPSGQTGDGQPVTVPSEVVRD